MVDTTSTSRSVPSERDLDRFTSSIRIAAVKRGFSRLVTDLYQDWIFLFVAWCLNAPPHRVHRERIGDFFAALNERDVNTSKICRAMDALAFFFGMVGQPEKLLFCAGELSPFDSRTFDVTEVVPSPSGAYYRRVSELSEAQSPNGGDSELGQVPDAARTPGADLGRYLPDGTLPETVDSRAAIPTREGPEQSGAANARASDAPPVPSASGSADQEKSTLASEIIHRTLFNPEETPPLRREEDSTADPSSQDDEGRESHDTAQEEVERLLSDLGLRREQKSDANFGGEEFEVTTVKEDDFSIEIPITLKIPRALLTFLQAIANQRGSATVICTSSSDEQGAERVKIESTTVVDSEEGTEQGHVVILRLRPDASRGD